MAIGVAGPFPQTPFQVTGAGLRIRAAEDVDKPPAAAGLRQELPAAARLLVLRQSAGERRRRIEFGFHGGGEKFDGLVEPAEAGGFFLDGADEVVKVVAGGLGKRVEEFLEAFGAAEGAGEKRVKGHGEKLL